MVRTLPNNFLEMTPAIASFLSKPIGVVLGEERSKISELFLERVHNLHFENIGCAFLTHFIILWQLYLVGSTTIVRARWAF